MSLDRKCIVCPDKHHYKYCSNCSGYNSKETWRFIFCSENCKGIYKIASDFVENKITKLEATEELKKYDISDLEFYHPVIKQNIIDILSLGTSNEIQNTANNIAMISEDQYKNKEISETKNDAINNFNTEKRNYQNKKRNRKK